MLGDGVLSLLVWSLWVQRPPVVYTFGRCLSYVARAMAKVHPGPEDLDAPPAARHSSALDEGEADLETKA